LIIDGVLNAFAPAGLTEYAIPDSVTRIGDMTFFGSLNLTSITIPDSVKSIMDRAFYNCRGLTNVTIGNSVTYIGCEAFYYCYNLTDIYCKPTIPPMGYGDYFRTNDASGKRKIYVPRNSVSTYQSSEYWSNYVDEIAGYDF
jgi:hypothetical protein